MHILVTGAAGFIGYHLSKRLLQDGHIVTGLDNLNDYYDPNLKINRLKDLGIVYKTDETQCLSGNFRFVRMNLEDQKMVEALFTGSLPIIKNACNSDLEKFSQPFDAVVNLAAQAGVRYSITNPGSYINSNITGFLSILEACRHNKIKHLIYASSSSVYGANTKMPFSVKDNVDHPVSLYAATKKANELMAHTYSHLYGLPTTGLRFFTVYGPWGRPDMALFLFAEAMTTGKPMDVYNYGNMQRDFTYIDDIIEGVVRLIPSPPEGNSNWSAENPDPSTSRAPYHLFNIGHNQPVALMDFIAELEKQFGITAKLNLMPIQPGDVPKTWADVTDLFEYTGYKPKVTIGEGIAHFVDWYKSYFKR